MSDLNTYLATHYLTADSKPSKKRKRKNGAVLAQSLLITDDDETGWSKTSTSSRQKKFDEGGDDVDISATVAGTSVEFRRAKSSGWKSLSGGSGAAPSAKAGTSSKSDDGSRPDIADGRDEADAVLASAVAEQEAARQADDDLPAVVEGGAGDKKVQRQPLMMADGTYAGLQTGAAVADQQRRQREREAAAEAEEFGTEGAKAGRKKKHREREAEETIYRDATGRRVDVSLKRAAAAAEAAEKEAQLERAKLLRGDVQEIERERRREELADARLMPLARRADDEDLNRELKEVERWNDPLTQFAASGGNVGNSSGVKRLGGIKGRPVYKGPASPNRYGIRPGYRWDGVDRSNGFEAERFKALNRRERNKDLEYSWQMDE